MTNRRFSDEEFLVAGIGGLGLILMILGGLTLGFGTNDGGDAQILLFAGAFLMILAIVLWLFITRPWESYDDLQTPYYTGHDHHDEHDEAVAVAEPAEVVPSEGASLSEPVADKKATPATEPAPTQTATEELVQDAEEAAAAVDKAEVEEVVETAKAAVEEKPAKKAKKAAPKTAAEPQDLRAIKGIGPKAQEALYADGINSYAQIAAMSADELEKVVKEKHGVRIRAGATESWPKQAQFLADGDADGLEAYQNTL